MAPANPVDHQRSAWQRCVLLACDSRQSVMTEVLAGDTNYLAFTPYGHLHSPNAVMTRMGFNGELREQRTGWYFLGNGYGAYNPRLMRFHSPDTFSPFGKGGMNAYMYCGGEPVMRADPTGEGWIFDKLVAPVLRLFSPAGNGGASITSVPVALNKNTPAFLTVADALIGQLPSSTPSQSAVRQGRSSIPRFGITTGIEQYSSQTTASNSVVKPRPSKFVLEGNYGVRNQNEYSKVQTKGGMTIKGTDSGTKQIASGSHSKNATSDPRKKR